MGRGIRGGQHHGAMEPDMIRILLAAALLCCCAALGARAFIIIGPGSAGPTSCAPYMVQGAPVLTTQGGPPYHAAC